ncbi:hypothetical protein B0H13DRAFT_2651855 [Mycena leptocephala]|nr:hypothetical protein B0H13DRAFT_2651855 [Mycena leptocephala]
MCARIPRRGRTASQTDSDTPEIGDQVAARGACRQRRDLWGCVLAIVRGITHSETGLPATHIICSGRGHQPSLLTPHPVSLCPIGIPAYLPPSSHSIASSPKENHYSRTLRVALLPRLPIPPPSILPSLLSPDSNADAVTHVGAVKARTSLCARGSAALVQDRALVAGKCARPVREGGCGVGLGVPELCSIAFAMWGDMPSGTGVLVAARCLLRAHPFASRVLDFINAIPILEAKNASTHSPSITCQPFRLYVVNIVRLPSLPPPPFTRYSSPSNPFAALPFLSLPILALLVRAAPFLKVDQTTAGAAHVAPSSANAMDRSIDWRSCSGGWMCIGQAVDEGARW